MGVQQHISPGTPNADTGRKDVPLVITRENDSTLATKITRKGVDRALSHMNRTVGLKFPATPTIVIEGTTKELDIV
jgi:hypothetical protein